jgi:hypothetical protein
VIDHDLKDLDEWSKKWLMSFNPDKTEILLFSNTDIPELIKFIRISRPTIIPYRHTSQACSKIGLI